MLLEQDGKVIIATNKIDKINNPIYNQIMKSNLKRNHWTNQEILELLNHWDNAYWTDGNGNKTLLTAKELLEELVDTFHDFDREAGEWGCMAYDLNKKEVVSIGNGIPIGQNNTPNAYTKPAIQLAVLGPPTE